MPAATAQPNTNCRLCGECAGLHWNGRVCYQKVVSRGVDMRFPRAVAIALLILVPAVMRATHFERSLVPMGALALFCGARFRSRAWAFAIPLASMAVGGVP